MATDFIVVDTVAIQNLFAGGGTTAWGQLLTGGKKVVLSYSDSALNFPPFKIKKSQSLLKLRASDMTKGITTVIQNHPR